MSPNLPPSSGSGTTACSGALAIEKLMPGRKDARITKANSIKVAATTKYSSRKLVGSGRSAVDEKNFLSPAG